MAKNRHRVRFSLFAFQDIITGLCGVLILIVLIMAVDFADSREASVKQPEIVPVEDAEIEKLKSEIAKLATELAASKEAARRVIVLAKGAAAPETATKLSTELTEKERELVALVSQTEDLRARVAAARDADARNKKKVREMEETRRILEKRIASLKERNGITLIPERGFHKIPVYLVCGRGGIEMLRPIEKSAKKKWIPFADMDDGVTEVLSELDHTTHTVILLVRPSGVERMARLAELVRGLGFSYGRDPLEEDVDVSLDNAEGAG